MVDRANFIRIDSRPTFVKYKDIHKVKSIVKNSTEKSLPKKRKERTYKNQYIYILKGHLNCFVGFSNDIFRYIKKKGNEI